MARRRRKKSEGRRLAAAAVLFLTVVLLLAGPAAATDRVELSSAERAEILRQVFGEEELFLYRVEDRPDPFMPFVTEKSIEQDTRPEESIPAEELTGLRRFEPGQLTLVAIVLKDDGPVAMVQDQTGKGYLVHEGTLIGRYGVVERISAGSVVIKQRTKTTWTREQLYKRIELFLPKEGKTEP